MIAPLPRIVHVATGREWRGGQRQVLLLARGLGRRGVDQVVVTSEGGRLAAELAHDGIPIHPARWHRGPSLAAAIAVWREARKDVTILHAHDAHALIVAGLVAPLVGAKLVVTRRVDFPIRRPGFWVRADRVIAISEAVQEVLTRGGVDRRTITVVHSGIDVEATRATTAGTIRAELGLPPTGPLAVWVAALVPHKGHRTLLRAAAALRDRHPDLHWALAGDGPLRGSLMVAARDLGVSGRVHFLGEIAEPLRLIRAADVFVLASHEEGLGTSVLDALALDIPVVATRAGGIPEMLGRGGGLLVPPAAEAELATAVDSVLSEPGVAERLRREASAAVAPFAADGMAERVLAVYRSLQIGR